MIATQSCQKNGLSSFLEEESAPPAEQMLVPLSAINTLRQVRQTFDPAHIETLANSIAGRGLKNEPHVALLDRKHCAGYLLFFNRMYGTKYQISHLTRFGSWYVVLIAGEQRCRALKILNTRGCNSCRREMGGLDVRNGKCFKRHFPTEVPVKAFRNISPLSAVVDQFHENHHFRVPIHEEAEGISCFFKILRLINPKVTYVSIASQYGCGVDTVIRAIQYCSLPSFIKQDVEKGRIKYGAALEFGRLISFVPTEEEGKRGITSFTKQEIIEHIRDCILECLNVRGIRDFVSSVIENKKQGDDLFASLSLDDRGSLADRRQVVEPGICSRLNGYALYLRRVRDLFRKKLLGARSPYSELSPLRHFRQLIEVQRSLLPEFRPYMGQKIREDLEKDLAQIEGTVRQALACRETEELRRLLMGIEEVRVLLS